jgi:hypothetical protein
VCFFSCLNFLFYFSTQRYALSRHTAALPQVLVLKSDCDLVFSWFFNKNNTPLVDVGASRYRRHNHSIVVDVASRQRCSQYSGVVERSFSQRTGARACRCSVGRRRRCNVDDDCAVVGASAQSRASSSFAIVRVYSFSSSNESVIDD